MKQPETCEKEVLLKAPIIAKTANTMKGGIEFCLNADMCDYITKPIKRAIVLKFWKNGYISKVNATA